jgi:hypothetical protein
LNGGNGRRDATIEKRQIGVSNDISMDALGFADADAVDEPGGRRHQRDFL